jgi:signal transduction histidine kinase
LRSRQNNPIETTAVPPSPTPRLLISLAATLAIVGIFSLVSLRETQGLRRLQTEIVEKNRRDSLQLIRIQNDLNLLGLAMRDMLDDRDNYGLTAWRGEFLRLQTDLRDAVEIESTLTTRPTEQRRYLADALAQFWRAADDMFGVAEQGDTQRARRIISDSLQAQQASLTSAVARLLVQNNEAEAQAAREISTIYDAAERHVYWFLMAMLAGTAGIGIAAAHYNRRLFDGIAALSQQRSTLARGLIGLQEEVFRSVSRELHDDFGQILTALGALLKRADNKHVPPDSPLREDLTELRQVVQETLEKTRSFSQALHPTILDDYGLVRAMERHVQTFSRQTGIPVQFDSDGGPPLKDQRGIHIYRILQEALTNIARHSSATSAAVTLRVMGGRLRMDIRDNGRGIPAKHKAGLGLIAMRERAELLGGTLRILRDSECGTVVTLEVPLEE